MKAQTMKYTEAMTNYIETLRKHAHKDGHSKVFNIAHAYLQGLQDAGVITETEHAIIFSYITGLE